MVSSRKEGNVRRAVELLKQVEGGRAEGMVCHVGKSDHRTNLIKEVRLNPNLISHPSIS